MEQGQLNEFYGLTQEFIDEFLRFFLGVGCLTSIQPFDFGADPDFYHWEIDRFSCKNYAASAALAEVCGVRVLLGHYRRSSQNHRLLIPPVSTTPTQCCMESRRKIFIAFSECRTPSNESFSVLRRLSSALYRLHYITYKFITRPTCQFASESGAL